MNIQKTRLEWVEALRGLAVLMVVVVHSRSALMDTAVGKNVADQVILPMAMGVDLFFIISGFLMVLTTRNFDGTKAYMAKLLAKRFARIWPLFALVAPVGLLVEHGPGGFLNTSLVLSFLEGLAFIPHDPRASGIYLQMAVGVAWTLCYEWYFYLIFALSMFFGSQRYVILAGWFALTLLAIPVARGGYNLNVATQPLVAWSRYANLIINPIVWDFVVGMAAAWLYGSRFKIRSATLIYAIALSLMVVLVLVWKIVGMVNFFGPFGWGSAVIILFVGASLLTKIAVINVPKWSMWMAKISYSLYLTHVYVFEVMLRITNAVRMNHAALEMVLFFGRPLCAVICAWTTFRYIEAPICAWTRRQLLQLLMPSTWDVKKLAVDSSIG